MNGNIYLLQSDGDLLPMQEQEYDSEDLLQTLLAKYPDLLAGDQMDVISPRKWLLIKRELGLPSAEDGGDTWSVDHLFLDQDAIPTIVEVKRSRDTRIRREVIGQMLDYAANAVVYWPMEKLRAEFEAQSADAALALSQLLGLQPNTDEFWKKVETNLRAGKIRLVFVADQIPPELQRVVEFLNEQMDPAEVLAVEIKQYSGRTLKTLVPRVVGQTAEAQQKKTSGEERQWDEVSFFQELETRCGKDAAEAARKILRWALTQHLEIWWGKGKKSGSLIPWFKHKETSYILIDVWTYGNVEVQFQVLKTRSPFDDEPKRLELLQRLNTIPGVSIPEEAITRRPSFALSALKETSSMQQLLNALNWAIEEIKKQ